MESKRLCYCSYFLLDRGTCEEEEVLQLVMVESFCCGVWFTMNGSLLPVETSLFWKKREVCGLGKKGLQSSCSSSKLVLVFIVSCNRSKEARVGGGGGGGPVAARSRSTGLEVVGDDGAAVQQPLTTACRSQLSSSMDTTRRRTLSFSEEETRRWLLEEVVVDEGGEQSSTTIIYIYYMRKRKRTDQGISMPACLAYLFVLLLFLSLSLQLQRWVVVSKEWFRGWLGENVKPIIYGWRKVHAFRTVLILFMFSGNLADK